MAEGHSRWLCFLIMDGREGWHLGGRHNIRSPAIPGTCFGSAGTDVRAAGRETMNDVSRQHHWEKVYTTKGESEVSWFQETPALSLELIELVGAMQNSGIIDIGGRPCRLAGTLVFLGHETVPFPD